MSYGIVRIQKMTAGSVKGIEIHDRREKDGISHTNKDIDWERTKDNYDLHENENRGFLRSVKERIAELELPKAVRKDAIVMAQALVTSDHSFFESKSPEETKQFFKDSYDFFCDRYGKENIISATVHLDEKTPHLHINFVPVTEDGRLSAKELFNRNSLRDLQDVFHDRVSSHYGLERGERGSKAKHLDVIDYKAATKTQELENTQAKVQALKYEIEGLQAKSQGLEARIESKLSYIENAQALPQGKKTLLGKIELTQAEHKLLLDTAKCFYRAHGQAEEMTRVASNLMQSTSFAKVEELSEAVSSLQKTVKQLESENLKLPALEARCDKLQKNLNWYKGFYDDLVLNVMERVAPKDKQWLKDTVLPKWAHEDLDKDLEKALTAVLNVGKSKNHDLSL